MLAKPFRVYWRVSEEYIPQFKESSTLEEALDMRDNRRERGYQAKIEVAGNDY